MNSFRLGIALTSICVALGLCPAWAGEMQITSLGNEGFLVEAEGHTVMIDGLYRGLKGYVAPSPEQLARREQAQPPFDQVELVLATHHHGDHFHAIPVGRHLSANPKAMLVTTPRAVEMMQEHHESLLPYAGRIRGIQPSPGKRARLRVGGIELEIMSLHHGRREPPVANLGFLVHLGSAKILHLGDTEASAAELGDYALPKDEIDVAFVPYWHLLSASKAAEYRGALGASTLIAMHLPAPDAPRSYLEPAQSLDGLSQLIEETAPDVVIIREPGTRITVQLKAGAEQASTKESTP